MGGESRSVLWRIWRSAAGRARRRVFGLIGACLGICFAPVNAATLSWDPAVSGGATLGGTGTWNSSAPNAWWNGSSNTTWTNSSANDAVFGGTAGTVSLGSSGLTAGDVQFNTAGYTLAFGIAGNSRSLTLSSLGGSALGSTTLIGNSTANTGGAVNITLNGDTSFNGIVANNGTGQTSFQKAGTGRLTLAAGFNYTATGNFSFSGGAVRLGTTSNLPSALDITGGVLELAAGNVSRVFSNFAGNRLRLNNAAANLGFAAIGADRTLTMNNTNDVTWGVAGDGFSVSELILATADSTGKLTFTHQNAGTGKGLRLQTGTVGTITRTIRVGNGTADIDAEITMPLMDGSTAGHVGALTKEGLGVLKLSAVNTYTGATSVSQGVLLIDGTTAASSAVSVASGGAIGGNGTINGNLTLDSGALFAFDTGSTLDLVGSFSLNSSFGVDDLVSPSGSAVDWANIAQDTYTLMNTSFTFNDTNISNFGTANAQTGLAGGKSAYFQQGSGSLELVVVPEPGTMALAAVGVATLAWAGRRRRSA